MKITNRKKALLGFAASTILMLGGCGDNSVDKNETPEVYGPPVMDIVGAPVYGIEYSEKDFCIKEIPDDIYENMKDVFNQEDCLVSREDLRYVHTLYYAVDGELKEGEMLVHKEIAQDVLEIMEFLYEKNYLLDSVQLPDRYDDSSMKDMMDQNNSYGFLYSPDIKDTKEIKHMLGLAVDINPADNSYNDSCKGITEDGLREDLCAIIFKEYNFEWSGDQEDSDLGMHFEIPDDVVEQLYPGVLGEE